MNAAFYILAGLSVSAAVAALCLRNLVHALLCLMAFFAGMAGLFVTLHADFLAGVQMLLYVGAVGVLLIFAIMFTRNATSEIFRASRGWFWGVLAATFVTALLVAGVGDAWSGSEQFPEGVRSSAKAIGHAIAGPHIASLAAVGVLLTAAMIGAVLVALPVSIQETPAPQPAQEPDAEQAQEPAP